MSRIWQWWNQLLAYQREQQGVAGNGLEAFNNTELSTLRKKIKENIHWEKQFHTTWKEVT